MVFDKLNNRPVHEKAEMYAKEYAEGHLSRREFMVRATALGVSSAAAYALIGQSDAEAAVKWTNPPKNGRHTAYSAGSTRAERPTYI